VTRIPTPQLAGIVVLAAIWGASFMFIKVMLEAMGPVAVAWVRLLGGAWFVLGVAAFRGARWPRSRRYWLDASVVAVLASAVPLVLIPWGERSISSQLAGLLNGSMPLWTALLAAAFLPAERLDGSRVLGLALGFAGVLVVIGPDVLRPAEASTQGALAVVLATLGYAANAVWIRRRLLGVNATLLAGTQNLLAVLLLTPLLLTVESVPDLPSMPARVVLASAALALLSSGVAYVIYYWLLTTLEATQASLVTYLIPLFALSWGALVLDESLPLAALPGLALIAAGMWLVARPRRALVIVPQPIDG
jgi:drug/metabolite transporter (DMT)-like permease